MPGLPSESTWRGGAEREVMPYWKWQPAQVGREILRLCTYRIMVSSLDFQSGDAGSTPAGCANYVVLYVGVCGRVVDAVRL